jgi:hypothetical protein
VRLYFRLERFIRVHHAIFKQVNSFKHENCPLPNVCGEGVRG